MELQKEPERQKSLKDWAVIAQQYLYVTDIVRESMGKIFINKKQF